MDQNSTKFHKGRGLAPWCLESRYKTRRWHYGAIAGCHGAQRASKNWTPRLSWCHGAKRERKKQGFYVWIAKGHMIKRKMISNHFKHSNHFKILSKLKFIKRYNLGHEQTPFHTKIFQGWSMVIQPQRFKNFKHSRSSSIQAIPKCHTLIDKLSQHVYSRHLVTNKYSMVQ